MDIQQLNTDFAIEGRLRVVEGAGGFPVIDVTADAARARVSVFAGQVLSFQPSGQRHDLLFLSQSAYYAPGKAIKGGVPICWPWFGPDPDGKGRPAHGFVRNRPWTLRATESLADGRIRVRLGLSDSADTRALWDHAFDLELCATVGERLDVALTTRNRGRVAFPLSQALHTYLAVGDIGKVRVRGLDGLTYIDKMDGGTEKTQTGAVTIDREVDRIYTGAAGVLDLEDAAWNRRISIACAGSASAVVWNPWAATAAAMGDLGDADYTAMLCVETANAGPDARNLAPGGEHRLAAEYTLSPL